MKQSDSEPRAHLWAHSPVRCWCGECHVLGVDDVDDDEWSSADDADAPDLDERLNGDGADEA